MHLPDKREIEASLSVAPGGESSWNDTHWLQRREEGKQKEGSVLAQRTGACINAASAETETPRHQV